jgi:hypothetical protein
MPRKQTHQVTEQDLQFATASLAEKREKRGHWDQDQVGTRFDERKVPRDHGLLEAFRACIPLLQFGICR